MAKEKLKQVNKLNQNNLSPSNEIDPHSDLSDIESLITRHTLNLSQFFANLQEHDKQHLQKQREEESIVESEIDEEEDDPDQYYIDLLQEKELEIEKIKVNFNQEVEKNKQISKQLNDLQTNFNTLLAEHQNCSAIRQQLLLDKLEIISRLFFL